MSLEDLRKKLTGVVDPETIRSRDYRKSGLVLEVRAVADQVEAVVGTALEAGLFLESITAADFVEGPQVIYHLNAYHTLSRVQVRVQLTRDQSLPTISSLYDAALWQEREVFDLFGIRFDNHPDLSRILLPEDANFHPLLKEYGKSMAFRGTKEIYGDTNN